MIGDNWSKNNDCSCYYVNISQKYLDLFSKYQQPKHVTNI